MNDQHAKKPSFVYQYELVDVKSCRSDVLIDAPIALGSSDVLWSPDSNSVVIAGTYLPLDVSDLAQRTLRQSTTFVAEVKIADREILPISSAYFKLIKWDSLSGKLFGRVPSAPPSELVQYQKTSTGWKLIEKPKSTELDNNIQFEVAAEEDMNTTPRIFLTNLRTGAKSLLLDLNPQFANLRFARVEEITFV